MDSNESVIIRVYGAPVAKGRPRFVARKNAPAFTPKRTRAYAKQVGWAARVAQGARLPLSGAVMVRIEAQIPIPKSWPKYKHEQARQGEIKPTGKPDIDNYIKAALDGCNEIVWNDDSQVTEVTSLKAYSINPHLLIVATPG